MHERRYTTEQEAFWAGEFGDAYAERNVGDAWIASNTSMFSEILRSTDRVESVLELGANIGLNLSALRTLLPQARLTGLEINESAVEALARVPAVQAVHGSIFDPPASLEPHDLVLVKGVLIHLAPERLADAYATAHRLARRYVCIAEYYNPTPVSIPYRGHADRLFKRDFAGEMLDTFSDLRLVAYGFRYRRDPNHPQDDLNWFLMERRQR